MPHSARFFLAVLVATLVGGRPASAQFLDEHFEPVPAAPDSGTYPDPVQQAILEGYAQLEQVSSPSDDAHLDAAEQAFERALEIDPRAAHALNGLGMYELGKDEQWLALLESLKKILNRDHISMAIDAFEKALAIDPELHAARFNLALAYRQARGEENYGKAIAELQRLLRAVPEFPQAGFLLAATYRDAGDIEQMAAIESIPASAALPEAGRQLLLAYALINSGQEDEGAAAYWRGVDAISSEHETDLYWFDIRPIVGPETHAEFQRLDVEGRKQFLSEFWQRLADDSFVLVDDRLAEHYRRLEHAYRNFRLPLPERRHYSGASAYVPPRQTGFDDRGVIYLRHGPPDDTASYSGPEVQQNVSWKYEQAGGDPLVFHFVSDEDIRDYKLVRHLSDAIVDNASKMTGQTMLSGTCGVNQGSICDSYDVRILATDRQAMRELYASRGSLDPYYDRASTALDPQILETEEVHLSADIRVGTTTSSYEPTEESDLPAPVLAVPFRNPGGETILAVYFALPTAEISVLPHPGGGSRVDYRYQLVVSGPGEETAARKTDDVTVASSRPIPREAGVMLPGVYNASISPGEYRYGMKMTDLNSGRSGIAKGSVTVDDLSAGGLSVSGIVLASRVEPTTDTGNPFVRWGRIKVLPLPSRLFLRSQPVFVYYEVYGLSGTPARYRTTYTLESREPDRNIVARFFSAVGELLSDDEKEGAITYSFERSQEGAVDPLLEYFSLDISGSPPGEYVLTVEIEDLATGESVRRQASLTLVG